MANTIEAGQSERQLVVFKLAGEIYGVDIGTVREIIRTQEITHVPNAPEFVEGVINLRGKVCPVIDLRRRFEVALSDVTDESRIVVVEIDGEDVGVIVDGVTEVLRISGDCVKPASDIIAAEGAALVDGIANLEERLILLVDLETALSRENRGVVSQLEAVAA
jgi:purine-binding chemotaxis protein CheW